MISSKIESNDTAIIEILELHPNEIQLLKAIRHKWRFGEITILVRDGLPFRMVRVQEFVDLTKKDGIMD